MRRTTILLLAGTLGCQSSAGGPQPEVEETQIKLDLPAPPSFVEPKPYPDGSHSVAEMRLKGQRMLDKRVTLTGYVVLQYDLAVCAREAGERLVKKDPQLCASKKDPLDCAQKLGQKAVDEMPDQCDRPYFLLADQPNAGIEKAVWVVEVPRPLRADEKRDVDRVQAFKEGPQPPTVKVGDKVKVTGTWAIKSPAGFGNSDGLLVYQASEPAT
jgi:hypothetical protein